MGVKFIQLSRLTFLRGAGVALGLPLLEGMLPLRSGELERRGGRSSASLAGPEAGFITGASLSIDGDFAT